MSAGSAAERICGRCAHFLDDREAIERELKGLLILSSAFGDTWGDQGLCQLHGRQLTPKLTCRRFSPRKP